MKIVSIAAASFASLALMFANAATVQTNELFSANFTTGLAVDTTIAQGGTTGITSGGGSWTSVPTQGSAKIADDPALDGSKTLLDVKAEENEKLVYSSGNSVANNGEIVSFTVYTDSVPELAALGNDAQSAFAILETNSTYQLYGYVAEGWTNLTGVIASSLTNKWFTFNFEFKNDEGRKVRFSVQPEDGSTTILRSVADGTTWFNAATKMGQTTVEGVGFTGNGNVRTFKCDTLKHLAEVTFDNIAVEYKADYKSATVTADVEGEPAADTTWTLTVTGQATPYEGTYNAETHKVTFNIAQLTPAATYSYTIAAGGDSTGTSGDQTETACTTSSWILANSASTVGGTWSPSAPSYSDGVATLSGTNSFNAATNAFGTIIVESVVKFDGNADTSLENPEGTKGGIRVGDNGGTATFQVWTKSNSVNSWVNVSNGTLGEPGENTEYTITNTIDTASQTYQVSVNGYTLQDSSSNTSFPFAADGASVGHFTFMGSGAFKSLKGEFSSTNVAAVVDGGGAIVVDTSWIESNLPAGTTVAEAAELLKPDADAVAQETANGINYFNNYALALNPEDSQDKPEVSLVPNGTGFTVKAVRKDGSVIEDGTVPEGVDIVIKVKAANTPEGVKDATPSEETDITPGDVTVKYYKAVIEVKAK